MKINLEKVRTWVPQGSRNGPQNHLKIDEKTHLVTASAAKAHFAPPGASGGTPLTKTSPKTHKKTYSEVSKIRQQISVTKYSEKHLPLQNPLERGGLGGAHLDIHARPGRERESWAGVVA